MLKIATIIAHYDVDGNVTDDLLKLTIELKKRSREILFISTNINDASIGQVAPYASVISRENIGYDFWSYKIGVDLVKDKFELDGILFLNSSFISFDPTLLCDKFFQSAPVTPCVYGLTSSNQISRHIQSYFFLICSNKLVNSPAFDVWWRHMTPISEWEEVIKKYEIGMSKYFNSINVPLLSAFEPSPKESIIASCRAIADDYFILADDIQINGNSVNLDITLAKKINPTFILWDILLEKYGVIKVKTMDINNRDFRAYGLNRYFDKMTNEDRMKCEQILKSRKCILHPAINSVTQP